jgi:hypothetical protein
MLIEKFTTSDKNTVFELIETVEHTFLIKTNGKVYRDFGDMKYSAIDRFNKFKAILE